MKFAAGDRVCWSHCLGADHAEGSILKAAAVPPGTPTGTVREAANERGTWFVVDIDPEYCEHGAVVGAGGTHPDEGALTLTSEELVKIAEE